MVTVSFPHMPSPSHHLRSWVIAGLALACAGAWPGRGAAQQPAPRLGTVIGVVIDSLHNTPLAHADVQIEGTTRVARSDVNGNFRFDSVAAGPIRLGVFIPCSIRWGSAWHLGRSPSSPAIRCW